jgi:hypothetical protein
VLIHRVLQVKKFAKQMMGTEDVRVDVNLNKFLWSKGVRNVPYRVNPLLLFAVWWCGHNGLQLLLIRVKFFWGYL